MSNTDKESFILITLDSCRYDTYLRAQTPNFDRIGQVHKAYAPGNFTLPSHMAMFCGFTPGDPKSEQDFVNPKIKRLWKLGDDAQGGLNHLMVLPGVNVVDGFNKLGYVTIGTGGVGWFDPKRIASTPLIDKFQHYEYFGDLHFLKKQIEWLHEQIGAHRAQRKFIFLNLGETHVPYWYEGADWEPLPFPCKSFSKENDREKSEYRQRKCLEYIDQMLESLLEAVKDYNIIICGDHGDAWGEDSLWEHSIHHEKVYEVPLVLRINRNVDYISIFNEAVESKSDEVNSNELALQSEKVSRMQMTAMEKELYKLQKAWEERGRWIEQLEGEFRRSAAAWEERGEWIKRLEEAKEWLATQNEQLKNELAKATAAWEERGRWIEQLEEERDRYIEQLRSELAEKAHRFEGEKKDPPNI